MKIYFNQDIFYNVITNDMIGTSNDYLNTHIGFDGSKPITPGKYPLDRYVVTINELGKVGRNDNCFDVFEVLDKSKFEDTQWQINYCVQNNCIKWKTKLNSTVNEIQLKNYINEKECLTIDLISNLTDKYSYKKNFELTSRFFKESKYFKTLKINDSDIELLARHPEMCQ